MLTSASHLSAPVVAAWGMGIDSTAMIIEWVAQGLPLSVVLTADTGTERDETYAFLPIFQQWMDARSIEHHAVWYVPRLSKLSSLLATRDGPTTALTQRAGGGRPVPRVAQRRLSAG